MAWLVHFMREQGAKRNPPSLLMGEVIRVKPHMAVRTGDMTLEAPFLQVAEHLLHSRIEGEATGTVAEIELSPAVEPGDRVAMLPTGDFQSYVVLCKVVTG